MTGAERREAITAEIVERTGITEAMIERLVRGFYDKVRSDAVLAPVFDSKIKDWEPHLAQMCAFWSSVALMTGRYHGTPMVKHAPLPVDADHFDRWLELFEATARRALSAARRQRISSSARGGSQQASRLGIANGQGVMLGIGEGFGVRKREPFNDDTGTHDVTDKDVGRSLFRQQPGADADCRACSDAGRDDRSVGVVLSASLRAKRRNPSHDAKKEWIASSLRSSQ